MHTEERRQAVQDDNGEQSKEELQNKLDFVTAQVVQTMKDLEASGFDGTEFREDDKVLYYTGLPTWELLLLVFTYFQSHLSPSRKAMSQIQKYLLL